MLFAGWTSTVIVILMGLAGTFDVYSIIVEYQVNGELLGERFIEHVTFVVISILTGCVAGISLGLWAARDERVAPIILYAVGIIQTIPSLALFGLLLFPLARFGDQLFLSILTIFAATLVLAGVLIAIYTVVSRRVEVLRTPLLIISAIAAAVPLALFTVVFVSFLFRISFLALTSSNFTQINTVFVLMLIAGFVMMAIGRTRYVKKDFKQYWVYGQVAVFVLAGFVLLAILFQSGQQYIRTDSIQTLTLRQLGVSGIGVAPALIALTLYSLLPLVRNTYAGLNNVDPAIIDSGRGMGMTPAQIFFRIELPLAFPVIMAGIRNAGIALIGIGTIATVIGGGGLGDFVMQGIINTSIDLILLGAIPAIIMALLLDGGLRLVESLLTSPGIRQVTE